VDVDASDFRFYPTIRRDIRTATIAGGASRMVVHPGGDAIYFLQPTPQQVTAVDAATLSITGVVQLPGSPIDMDITPSGDSLLVLLRTEGTLAVVDLRDLHRPPRMVPIVGFDAAGGEEGRYIRVAANGKALITLDDWTWGDARLLELDFRTGTQTFRQDGEGQHGAGLFLARSQDFRVLVLNGAGFIRTYHADADSFGPLQPSIDQYAYPVVDSTGRWIAVGLSILDQDLALRWTIPNVEPHFSPVTVAFDTDGESVYLVGGHLYHHSLQEQAPLDRSLLPHGSAGLPEVSRDGRILVVRHGSGGPVSVSVVTLR
jgi:DNA-binding beta-propeller fold protein YncE